MRLTPEEESANSRRSVVSEPEIYLAIAIGDDDIAGGSAREFAASRDERSPAQKSEQVTTRGEVVPRRPQTAAGVGTFGKTPRPSRSIRSSGSGELVGQITP